MRRSRRPAAGRARPVMREKIGTAPIFLRAALSNGKWGLSLFSVEADDFHPVRALAGRDLADRHQAAVRLDDRIRGDGFRFLAGDDHEASRGVDAEAARLLLRGGAAEVGEVAGSGVDAECADRAAGALRGVQEFPVWREVQV